MKAIKLLAAALLLTWTLAYTPTVYADIYEARVPVTFSGGQRTVNAVYVDLNDKTTRIEAAVAHNQIGQAVIPAEGYTIVMGANDLFHLFKVGTKVDYRLEFNQTDFSTGRAGQEVDWSKVRTTINAGATLF